VLERDPLAEFDDAESAFAVRAPGRAPGPSDARLPGPLTVVLRQHFPDVLDACAAGAESMTLTGSLGEPEPGDEDLNTLIVRRTTFEWVLREAVRREPGVTYRADVELTGSLWPAGTAGCPHVSGARLADGSVLSGDVIACTGRRGAVPAWLAEVGVDPGRGCDRHPHHLPDPLVPAPGRVRSSMSMPAWAGDFGYLKYLAIPCDGSTFSVTLAVRSHDPSCGATCSTRPVFDRACRVLPGPDRFFGSAPLRRSGRPTHGRADQPAAPLHRPVTGQPLVTGFHAVGDAHTCTNPMYGRGCSLAFVQATLLADAYRCSPRRSRTASRSPTSHFGPGGRALVPPAVMMDSFGDSDGVPKEPDARS
jgi:2-polyprenyl-6-methoxyphenol hydroxylase-like FAD-dependent oxidoreductase